MTLARSQWKARPGLSCFSFSNCSFSCKGKISHQWFNVRIYIANRSNLWYLNFYRHDTHLGCQVENNSRNELKMSELIKTFLGAYELNVLCGSLSFTMIFFFTFILCTCRCIVITLALFSILPGGFQVQSLNWHCSGDSLILLGKEQLCLCYMDTDQEDK